MRVSRVSLFLAVLYLQSQKRILIEFTVLNCYASCCCPWLLMTPMINLNSRHRGTVGTGERYHRNGSTEEQWGRRKNGHRGTVGTAERQQYVNNHPGLLLLLFIDFQQHSRWWEKGKQTKCQMEASELYRPRFVHFSLQDWIEQIC